MAAGRGAQTRQSAATVVPVPYSPNMSELEGRGAARTEEQSELPGRGAAWTEEQSERPGRGAAWTEERGTSDEGGGAARRPGERAGSKERATREGGAVKGG